jgi:crossover junction endodeoxyribonuclease RuvC
VTTVIGVDLSLTSTALALVEDGVFTDFANITSKGTRNATYRDSLRRAQTIMEDVEDAVCQWRDNWRDIDLVVLEAPSLGSRFGSSHERAGLWWMVYELFDGSLRDGALVTVPPTSRAKYITGSGRGDKALVLSTARSNLAHHQDCPTVINDDVADALGLAALGSRNLGDPVELEPLTVGQLEAWKGVPWVHVMN